MSTQETTRAPYLTAVAHNQKSPQEQAQELSPDERADLLMRYGQTYARLVKMNKLLTDNPNGPQAPQLGQQVADLRKNLNNLQLRVDAAGLGADASAHVGNLMAQLYQVDATAAAKAASDSAAAMRQQYLSRTLEADPSRNPAWTFNRTEPQSPNVGPSPTAPGAPTQAGTPGFVPGSIAEKLYQYKASRQANPQNPASVNPQDRWKNQAPLNHAFHVGADGMANTAYNRMSFEPVSSGPGGAMTVVVSMMVAAGLQTMANWFTNITFRGGNPWVGPTDPQ